MQAGISTASLFTRKNNEEALPFFNEIGVKTAEVFLTSFSEYDPAFAKQLAKDKGDVQVNSMHVLNTQFEPQLFSGHERVLKDAYYWLEKVLACANELGAPYYTFHGTARIKRATRSGARDDFPAMIDGFSRLVSFCRGHGVTVCLENVEWATYNRPGVFSKIAAQVPDLRGVLDIKQARISEYPYDAYLKEMGEKIAYVHVSDLDENGKMCLPGKGCFDFDTLISRLLDVGFDGNFYVEVYNKDFKEEQELKTACDFLNECFYKHGCYSDE
ncbi:MAG: sugar phosphate isomerase/epimerase [Clostridia bacterium]|nr:sugar phosphate isomerase/epimerase [Clostridia bacterium]